MGQQYDAILFIDADAFIANPDIRVEDRFTEELKLLVTADINGLNNGIFIIKGNCSETHELIYCILNHGRMIYQSHPCREQECMRWALSSQPYNEITTWAKPQNYLMSYANRYYGRSGWRGDYQPGDWMVHMPGMDDNSRISFTQEVNGE